MERAYHMVTLADGKDVHWEILIREGVRTGGQAYLAFGGGLRPPMSKLPRFVR